MSQSTSRTNGNASSSSESPNSRPPTAGSAGCRTAGWSQSNRMFSCIACLIAIVSLGILSGCGSSGTGTSGSGEGASGSDTTSSAGASTPGGNPQTGGTLNVTTSLPLESLNQLALPPTAEAALTFVYETLVTPEKGTNKIVGALADSWKVTNGGKVYTFHLRPNVKFSNGDPLTSRDVVYSLNLWKKFMLELAPSCCEKLTKIWAPSNDSVQLDFSVPAPNLLQYLAWNAAQAAGIMDASVREEIGEEAYAKKPIGTGPFMVASFHTGEAKLVRNPLYWKKGLPYLEAVNVTTVEDPNTRILGIKSGETQVATGIPYDQVAALEGDPSGNLLVQNPWAGVYTTFINSSQAPLKEKAVRRALSYATDRETILKNALGNLGGIANSVGISLGTYNESVKQLPYDLEKAKEELAKSSVPNGFHVELLLESGDTSGNITAAILQDSFKKIGITSTIKKEDRGTYVSDFVAGKYQLAVGPFDWWGSLIEEPDQMFHDLFASPATHNTFTWYENEKGAKLAAKLLTSTDEKERLKLATELQELSVEDPPILAEAFLTNVTLTSKEVCNFHTRPVSRVLENASEVYLSSEC